MYTRFCWRRKSARGIDASPIVLSNTARSLSAILRSCDGARSLSAIEELTRKALTLYEQFLFLPGEVVQVITRYHAYQTCVDHGCTALSQLYCPDTARASDEDQ